jgi:hypothetical protein
MGIINLRVRKKQKRPNFKKMRNDVSVKMFLGERNDNDVIIEIFEGTGNENDVTVTIFLPGQYRPLFFQLK